MTRDEIVTALRQCPRYGVDCAEGNCAFFKPNGAFEDCIKKKNTAAADLIENQQRHIEALMRPAAYEDTGLAPGDIKELLDMAVSKTDKVLRLKEELHTIKNELCQYCGKYKHAHEGSCDGCKWGEK